MQQSTIIVGSGIAGASTFFALASRRARVLLVDDGAVGQATAASAGIVQPWSSDSTGPYYELYAAGAAYYPELLSKLERVGVTRTDYRRVGGLIVNADAAALDGAEALLESRRAGSGAAMGAVRRLGPAAARTLFPPLADGLGAVHVEGGARVDGRTLRDALLEAGRRCGGTVRSGRAELDAEGAGGTGGAGGAPAVIVDGERLRADAVVVAAGAWTNELLSRIGPGVAVTPQRGQITHLRLDGVDTAGWPSVHPLAHHYIVAFDGGRIAVGATRENGAGFDARVTALGQRAILADALSVAPGLADATLIETRVGLRPLPGDGVPTVGRVPGCEGLFVATGYGAGGLTMGPLLGELLARVVTGEALAGETAARLAPVAPR